MSNIEPGQDLVLEIDNEFDEVAVKNLDGAVIGFIMHTQPKGCISAFRAMQKLHSCAALAKAALVAGSTAVLISPKI